MRENPLVIRALMLALGLSGLALEWPDELTPVIGGYLAGRPLADHLTLWFGDGRITAGHLAVLRERAAAGPLDLTLFDGPTWADWSWSQRDEAMAERILAQSTTASGTLAVAGNAHTPTGPTSLGLPLGAYLARQRPGVRSIRIKYGGGRFYNLEPRRFRPRVNVWRSQVRLRGSAGTLSSTCPAPARRPSRSGPSRCGNFPADRRRPLNRYARRSVYQGVTGRGGRRRAGRACFRVGKSQEARSVGRRNA